jgi:hypothetical protein
MWKELVVAYNEVGNIAAFVSERNDLCIKLIIGKLKRLIRGLQFSLSILQGEI